MPAFTAVAKPAFHESATTSTCGNRMASTQASRRLNHCPRRSSAAGHSGSLPWEGTARAVPARSRWESRRRPPRSPPSQGPQLIEESGSYLAREGARRPRCPSRRCSSRWRPAAMEGRSTSRPPGQPRPQRQWATRSAGRCGARDGARTGTAHTRLQGRTRRPRSRRPRPSLRIPDSGQRQANRERQRDQIGEQELPVAAQREQHESQCRHEE